MSLFVFERVIQPAASGMRDSASASAPAYIAELDKVSLLYDEPSVSADTYSEAARSVPFGSALYIRDKESAIVLVSPGVYIISKSKSFRRSNQRVCLAEKFC